MYIMSKEYMQVFITSCYKFSAECAQVSNCSGRYKLYHVMLEMCQPVKEICSTVLHFGGEKKSISISPDMLMQSV